ncbi:MAG: hypothetical protein ACREBF_01485 [Candidatus Micrarchaeales archaeon]
MRRKRGGGIGIVVVVIAIVAIVGLWLSGTIHTGTPTPTAQLSVSQSSIPVQSGQNSAQSNPITFKLQNVQNANNTIFNVVFNSSNQTNVYAVYFNGTRVTTINSSPLIGVEPFTSPPFVIFGKKPAGVTSSVGYNVTLSLYYKGSLLSSQSIQVMVN